MSDYPAIPEATADIDSLLQTVSALKQAVELLTGQRAQATGVAAFTQTAFGVANAYIQNQILGTNDLINATAAALTVEQLARADADSALTVQITELDATVNGTITALIDNEQQARAAADSALASDVTSIQATVYDSHTGLAAVGTALDSLTAEVHSSVDGLQVTVGKLDVLTAEVHDPGTGLGTKASTAVTNSIQATVNSVTSQYGVQITIDGTTGGYKLTGIQQLGNPGVTYVLEIDANVLINGSITVGKIADSTITGAKIASNTITGTKIATGTLTDSNIASGTITGTKIAGGTITTGNIAAQTITANNISAGTITGDKIAAATLTASNIAADTITAGQIAAGAITTPKLAAGSVTAATIAAGTITATQIAANTITAAQIAAGTITATQLAANTITAAQIAAGTITGTQIAASTITGSKIAAGTITADLITAHTIAADRLVLGGVDTAALAANAATKVSQGSQSVTFTADGGVCIGFVTSDVAFSTSSSVSPQPIFQFDARLDNASVVTYTMFGTVASVQSATSWTYGIGGSVTIPVYLGVLTGTHTFSYTAGGNLYSPIIVAQSVIVIESKR